MRLGDTVCGEPFRFDRSGVRVAITHDKDSTRIEAAANSLAAASSSNRLKARSRRMKATSSSRLAAVSISSVWAFAFTYGMLWLIDKVTPVKVDQAAEESGLDAALHGETAYLGTP